MIRIVNVICDNDSLCIEMDGDKRSREFNEFEEYMLHVFVRHDNPDTECNTVYDSPNQPAMYQGIFTPDPTCHIHIRSDYEFIHDFAKYAHGKKWMDDCDFDRIDHICRSR